MGKVRAEKVRCRGKFKAKGKKALINYGRALLEHCPVSWVAS
jgi:hypothetical protein